LTPVGATLYAVRGRSHGIIRMRGSFPLIASPPGRWERKREMKRPPCWRTEVKGEADTA